MLSLVVALFVTSGGSAGAGVRGAMSGAVRGGVTGVRTHRARLSTPTKGGHKSGKKGTPGKGQKTGTRGQGQGTGHVRLGQGHVRRGRAAGHTAGWNTVYAGRVTAAAARGAATGIRDGWRDGRTNPGPSPIRRAAGWAAARLAGPGPGDPDIAQPGGVPSTPPARTPQPRPDRSKPNPRKATTVPTPDNPPSTPTPVLRLISEDTIMENPIPAEIESENELADVMEHVARILHTDAEEALTAQSLLSSANAISEKFGRDLGNEVKAAVATFEQQATAAAMALAAYRDAVSEMLGAASTVRHEALTTAG